MLSDKVKTKLLILVLSFIVAIALWFNISVYDKIVAQVEVRIDYKGRSDNLVVLEGLVNSVKVRMRGPKTLIRSMTTDDLTYIINLADIKKGKFVIPFEITSLDEKMRAIEVLEIYPPQLTLVVDSMVDRVVKLIPKFQYNFKNGIINAEVLAIKPKNITLHGPQSLIDKIKTLTLNIPIDLESAPGIYTNSIRVAFEHSNLVISKPHEVQVEYKVLSKRKKISLKRKINLGIGVSKDFMIQPDSFTLEVEVPEELAGDASYLNKVYLSAIVGAGKKGEIIEALLQYELPEGMVLLSPLPKSVKVIKKK